MNEKWTNAFKMIDAFLEISQIEKPDELEKQLIAAYIFGMLNGMAQSGTLSPEDVIYTEGNVELVKSDFLEIVGAVKS